MTVGLLVCQGHVAGPKLLDGRTGDGSVALTNNSTFSGTRWQIIEQPNSIVILKCLGDVDGPRFLDGRIAPGGVELDRRCFWRRPGRRALFSIRCAVATHRAVQCRDTDLDGLWQWFSGAYQ